MKDTDKNLAVKSALIVADNIVASFDLQFQTHTNVPLTTFGTCWGLVKALYGSVIKRRSNKAVEWVSMVDENRKVFTMEILADEAFQDGFAYALERYLIERNSEKRKIFRNIFLGFAESKDKEGFPLEKLVHILSQLSEGDIEVLGNIKIEVQESGYQAYAVNTDGIENILNLIREGLLLDTTGTRIGYPQDSPYIRASSLGKEFIKFLKETS